MTRAAPPPPEGAVLVRVRAAGPEWSRHLPTVPGGTVLTVTVGHPSLVPVPIDDLIAGGYRIAGVAEEHRPFGPCVDVLVPLEVRLEHPAWWRELAGVAERVFDLRMGPVRAVLGREIDLHLAASG